MAHPREEFDFTTFYEVVADRPDRVDAHITFTTSPELAEKFIAHWTKHWTEDCTYTNPGWRKVYAINSMEGCSE